MALEFYLEARGGEWCADKKQKKPKNMKLPKAFHNILVFFSYFFPEY